MNKNDLIKNGIRKSFETDSPKIADKVCYGYAKITDGSLVIHEREAQIVRFIFDRFLSGDSLRKIVDALAKKKVVSPSRKDKWSRKVVDGLLSVKNMLDRFFFKKLSFRMADKLRTQTQICSSY